VGARDRVRQRVEDQRLLQDLLRAPRRAPAVDRPPVTGGDEAQPLEAGVADDAGGGADVGGDLRADEDDPDRPAGGAYDRPSFTGGMKWM
jgi:hypothetical protein